MEPSKLTIDRSFRRGLAAFNQDRLQWLDEAAALGPLVGVRFGRVTAWVLTDVELARRVLITESAAFVRSLNFRRPTSMAIGKNLFTESQNQWEVIDPHLSPQLHGAAVTRRLDKARSMIVEDVSHWPTGVPIDLDEATSRLVLRAACLLLFDYGLDFDRANDMVHHQRVLMGWLGDRIGRPSSVVPFVVGRRGREMHEHREAFYSNIRDIIARGKSNSDQETVLSALLAVRQSGVALSERALCGHVAGLIGAGNDVTGATLAWALVYGAQNPDAFRALRTPQGDAHAYVLESVRLSSCAWSLTRVPTREVSFSTDQHSTVVSRRSPVIVYLRGMNRSPAAWTEPNRFDPMRHATEGDSHRKSFIPFGLGVRGCPGQQIALAELEAAVPAIAERGRVIIDGPVAEDLVFAIRVRGGLRGRIEPFEKPGTPD
jgi:cytochrome P450